MKEILFKFIWRYMLTCGFVLLGKDDPPPPPDYTQAAKATADGNLQAAQTAAAANRVNQVTPYGNLNYTNNPTVAGQPQTYTATQTLSPTEQTKLTANNNLQTGLLGTAQKGLSGVDNYLSQGFDFSKLPAQSVNAGQTAQDAIMARLTPQFNTGENDLRTRLTNEGLAPGGEAWNNEFKNFNQSKNDAYSQAALNGIGVGQQARQQALQEQEFGRTEGLNMVNALRTGNQVQSPSFVNTPQQATTAGADYLGAMNSKYQNQLGAYNASNASSAGLFGGLASAAGSVLGGPIGGAAAKYFTG